jgi:D-serine deaminase-like pyridoxal phosphate-dependent protein
MNTKLSDLRTPSLLLDLDIMEGNLHRMASHFRHGKVRLRPHFKNHQVLALAAKQVEAGAIGITCARIEHAEALVSHGIERVLIANEIAGERMVREFIELSRRSPVIVAVDNAKTIADMARRAGDRAKNINVVVDVDLRLKRCGVAPGAAALSLAQFVLEKGLNFRGLMGYPGSFRMVPGPEKEETVRSVLGPLVDTRKLLEGCGIPVEIVTCGGTGDYSISRTLEGVTEIQAGSYLLMDSEWAKSGTGFQPSLSVLVTVINKTGAERLVANVGVKGLSCEKGFPEVRGNPGLRVRDVNAEHTLIDILDPALAPEIRETLELWVRYLDPTVQLHDRMYGIRNGAVETEFKIER